MNTHLLLLVGGLFMTICSESLRAATRASVANAVLPNPELAQIPEYIVIDLGTLGGTESHARDINERGEVAGVSQNGDSGSYHAFLYSNGSLQDLGTLNAEHSEALGINDHGEVVGVIWNDDYSLYHAFRHSDGTMEDLGTLGGKYSIAFDVNNAGQVIGWSRIGDALGSNRAFLYENGVMRSLGRLQGGNNSEAFGIDSAGHVVGASTIFGFGRNRAFLYSDGTMKNLGTLLGDSQANGISDAGHIVGESTINSFGETRAFLFADGRMQNLGTLGGSSSWAYGVNDFGQVVGESKVASKIHAFLYLDGSMLDLNDLIDPSSKWRLNRATAINNAGQIVGTGINPSGEKHGFLLNLFTAPNAPPGIGTQSVQPTYGEPPKREDGKDSLIVVTHGWNPDVKWLDEMTNAITGYLTASGLKNWQVHAHKWVEKATAPLYRILSIAEQEGGNLGNYLAPSNWLHIHLIAHSAGSALVEAASRVIKNSPLAEHTVIHSTFLDAYAGFVYGGRGRYGKETNWSDSYFSRDLLTGMVTEGPLDHTYNADITWLDPSREEVSVVYSTPSGAVSQTCYQQVTSHGWPYRFYMGTIPPNTAAGSEGFGFPLSKEGGNWDFATNTYRAGSLKVLGSEGLSCKMDSSTGLITTWPTLDFSKLPSASVLMSSPVNVIIRGVDFTLKTASPAWLAVSIPIAGKVNFVSLEARFTSAIGAEGLLSVYWETNVIGSIDERVTLPSTHQYTFPLPETVMSGTRMLGFRLDTFSAVQSSAVVTNVALGFAGVREPFSLSFTGMSASGSPVLRLMGPAGFNYLLESSTSLTDWKTTAVLVNTNGTVRFADQTSKNTPTRFYRAVVP